METQWTSLKPPLSEETVSLLRNKKYKHPLPVQTAVIPLILSHKDVAAEAVTGSGKTLAFVVPILEMFRRKPKSTSRTITGLILVPTYELSIQVAEVATEILGERVNCQLISGGGGRGGQRTRLDDWDQFQKHGADVLIATPGRFVDLLRMYIDQEKQVQLRTNLSPTNPFVRALRGLEILVLDEADRLLDMGFESQLNTILAVCPKQRRTALFSATQAKKLEDLVRAGLRNPVRIVVRQNAGSQSEELRIPTTLEVFYVVTPAANKLALLVNFLLQHQDQKIIVFFATCACVTYFATILKGYVPSNNTKATEYDQAVDLLPKTLRDRIFCLHGRLKNKRYKIFEAFRTCPSGVLLCTDVIARGIDLPEVHWVLQFDPPTTATSFIHRCGRTARCGDHGRAAILLNAEELSYVDFLRINQGVTLASLEPTQLVGEASGMSLFDANAVRELVQAQALKDKLVYERAMKAFVSYVQFYRKHECHLLFQLKNLDFGNLANAFGLLRMPKMPELRGADVSAFIAPGRPVDLQKLKYKSKSVEKQREKAPTKPQYKPHVAFSRAKEKRLKKKAKLAAKKARGSDDTKIVPIRLGSEPVAAKKKKRKQAELTQTELDELNDDYADYKRSVRKKRRKLPQPGNSDEFSE